MCDSIRRRESILTGAAFAFFLFITCYKLTNASLSFDETVEYWYSKVMFGPIPFDGYNAVGTTNMYQRIISTYQPPLYNVIMHFWLKVSDTEWWFRFFGVVMGFLGMVGIYKSVKKVSNTFLAAGAVFLSSMVYQLVYFWQQCSEYCLMLSLLCWTMYFWILLLLEANGKNIILFTVLAIASIYSQYGAAFPVLVMAVVAFLVIIGTKNKKNIITICISYVSALIFAALPLYFFFLRPQMLEQSEGVKNTFIFGTDLLKDTVYKLQVVFKWNFAPYYSEEVTWILFLILICGIVVSLIFSKSKMIRILIITNICTWLCYYVAVKLGIYALGIFGHRYNLFFIPMWIVLLFGVGYDLYSILERSILKKWDAHNIFSGVCLCFTLCYAVLSWNLKLEENWEKADSRGAVQAWYEQGAAEKSTIVYYGADAGFAYYVRMNDAYNDQTENNVTYMYWNRDKSSDEYLEYVNSVYGDEWPYEVFVVASHYGNDLDTFMLSFTEHGYVREDLYDENGGKLIKFTYNGTCE